MTEKYDRYRNFIFVCKDKDCKKAGAKELEKSILFEIKKQGLQKSTKIIGCKCTDRCKEAPVVIINNNWIGEVSVDKIDLLIQQYIQEND